MGADAGTEPEGRAFELRLEDRLQHELGSGLHHPILHGGDSQRTGLPVPFGDLHPPDRLGAVGFLAETPREGVQELRHALGLDLLDGLLIDPRAAGVPAHQFPGGL